MELEDFKNSFEDISVEYYNKHFAGQKGFEDVYLEQMDNCMKSLLAAHCKFLLLLNSMKQLTKDIVFYKKCSEIQKTNLKESINYLES